jgi:hypothetical protein
MKALSFLFATFLAGAFRTEILTLVEYMSNKFISVLQNLSRLLL